MLSGIGYNQNASAINYGDSNAKPLVFNCLVESNHCLPHLDYLDMYSFETNPHGKDGNEISMIRRSSTKPTIMAGIQLPIPRSKVL